MNYDPNTLASLRLILKEQSSLLTQLDKAFPIGGDHHDYLFQNEDL